MDIRRYGDRAALIDGVANEDAHRIRAALTAVPLFAQRDVIAGASTVLVRFSIRPDLDTLTARVGEALDTTTQGPSAMHTVEMVYDGQDLAALAEEQGMSVESLIAWHSGQSWVSAFVGFSPGFAYLVPPAPRRIRRHPRPRTRVPAGSVALAGEYSAVYPQESPGGWQLIGRTNARVWDLRRDPPALLAPGDVVRFRPVRELVAGVAEETTADHPPEGTPALLVSDPGLLSLVEDAGRPGRASLGVSPSGAADPRASAEANRLVGNRPAAAVLEVVCGGVELEAIDDVVLAVVGPGVSLQVRRSDGRERSPRAAAPFALRPAERLLIGADGGHRGWVAIRGGIAAPRTLGSSASDTLSRLGPAPLRAGDVVHVGGDAVDAVATPDGVGEEPAPASPAMLRVIPGPRADWFAADALALLADAAWTVTPQSNRVGLRLSGPKIDWARIEELPSEGIVPGAIQVTPSGELILFLTDHPVTGGYPVIAVVATYDLRRAVQLRGGDDLRFTVLEEQ